MFENAEDTITTFLGLYKGIRMLIDIDCIGITNPERNIKAVKDRFTQELHSAFRNVELGEYIKRVYKGQSSGYYRKYNDWVLKGFKIDTFIPCPEEDE
jgi:hypothetical protein